MTDERIEQLARRLTAVTAALVEADGQIERRVDRLEQIVRTIGDSNLGPDDTHRLTRELFGMNRPKQDVPAERPKRPSLLARLTRRTGTYQGAGPEGAE